MSNNGLNEITDEVAAQLKTPLKITLNGYPDIVSIPDFPVKSLYDIQLDAL